MREKRISRPRPSRPVTTRFESLLKITLAIARRTIRKFGLLLCRSKEDSVPIESDKPGLTNEPNAESVRKFQPRVCFETLGTISRVYFGRNAESVATGFAGFGRRHNSYRASSPVNEMRLLKVAKAQRHAEICQRLWRKLQSCDMNSFVVGRSASPRRQ